jgi:hypothetical protein
VRINDAAPVSTPLSLHIVSYQFLKLFLYLFDLIILYLCKCVIWGVCYDEGPVAIGGQADENWQRIGRQLSLPKPPGRLTTLRGHIEVAVVQGVELPVATTLVAGQLFGLAIYDRLKA